MADRVDSLISEQKSLSDKGKQISRIFNKSLKQNRGQLT